MNGYFVINFMFTTKVCMSPFNKRSFFIDSIKVIISCSHIIGNNFVSLILISSQLNLVRMSIVLLSDILQF